MENQSRIDPSRKTVGAIYQEAAKNNTDKFVTNGDLTNELMSSLVCDINETAQSKPYDDLPFYITVYEKKDLQMQRAILRRLYTTKYRPYPEDDTIVWYVDAKSGRLEFCWCLPHSSEMENILANELLYNKEMVEDIKRWKAHDLFHFGFEKDQIGNWHANPIFKDRKLKEKVLGSTLILN